MTGCFSGSVYRSDGGDTVRIKHRVCHISNTVMIIKQILSLCEWFSRRPFPWPGTFRFGSSSYIFHGKLGFRFYSLFSKVSKLSYLDFRFRVQVWGLGLGVRFKG